MKIYIVHENAIPEGKYGDELTDEEIEKMYAESTDWIDCYESIEELEAYWNNDSIFYPLVSYMRVVREKSK